MVVQHNLTAMNANRMYGLTSNSLAKTTEKLSSGYKINRAADDAAGLSISEKLRRQIRGLNQGAENIEEGTSLCQVADGALSEVDELLQRANELAVQAANGTNTSVDRSYIQQEVDAIVSEITRIGKQTTFNEIKIFDKETIESYGGEVKQLVSSSAADTGYMNEAYFAKGQYYPSTSLDFSNVNASNIKLLDGGNFSFNCTVGCSEKFTLKFANSYSGENPVDIPTGSDRYDHQYTIDLSKCTDGNSLVSAIYNTIKDNPSEHVTASGASMGGLAVSHSNVLVANGSKLIITSNTRPQSTKEAAEKVFPLAGAGYNPGKVDVSGISNIYTSEPILTIPIQCSSNVYDKEYVHTRWMDGEALGIDSLDVSSSQDAAGTAIDKIKSGMEYIATMRSDIGAEQNRLEHSYNNNLNVSENTTAAESRIRDTDMAEMMVKYSNENIILQAGQTMLTQANQSKQMVLSLLQ